MNELIASLVGGIIALPLAALVISKTEARKYEKERLHIAQNRLHRFALRFRDECEVASKTAIEQYTIVLKRRQFWNIAGFTPFDFLTTYSKAINNLRDEYIGNYAQIYSNGDNSLLCEAEDLPRYIVDAYCTEIDEFTQTFREIGNYMRESLQKVIDENSSLY